MDRSRLRRGRDILYNPTAAEVTALGAGPWPGLITQVNPDGTCSLHVDTPLPTTVGAAVADPLITSASGVAAAGANPTKAEYDVVVTLANELKADVITLAQRVNQLLVGSGARQKSSVHQGAGPGQFSLVAGADAV